MKVLLLGYYGYGNFGDELMKLGIIDFLEKFNIQYTLALPKRVSKDTISRFNIFELLESIYDSDVVVYGGGGLLQDITSTRSFLYYALIIRLSLLLKTPVILFGNSIGPVKKSCNRLTLRNILKNRNVFLFARDIISYKYGKYLNKSTELSCDPSIRYLRKVTSLSDKCEKKYDLIIIPRESKNIDQYKILRNYFDNIFILPAQKTDYPVAKRLANILKADLVNENDVGDVDKTISHILSSKFVVSERFHGSVVASYFGVPFLSLENSKTQRFFRKYTQRKEFFAKDLVDFDKRIGLILNSPLNPKSEMDKECDESFKKLYRIMIKLQSRIII
ncbi:MAG: polysaccharide pyruvyl transferase family protein [Fervidobacterium sp.]